MFEMHNRKKNFHKDSFFGQENKTYIRIDSIPFLVSDY